MITFNILIALLALATTIVSSINLSEKGNTKSEKIKYIALVLIGILTMIFTLVIICKQKTKDKLEDTEKANLKKDVKDIQSKLNVKIKSDSAFELWLKDTFGIKRRGDTAIIYNTNNYFSQINQGQKEKPDLYPDSTNYGFSFLHNKDTLILYPKNGVWVKPFLSFDAKLDKVNGGVYQSDGMGKPYSTKSGPSEITNVNGKNYKTISVFMNIVRSKSYPLIIDMKGYKNQYIIFGDSADPNKRYIYQKGKVRWIPIR